MSASAWRATFATDKGRVRANNEDFADHAEDVIDQAGGNGPYHLWVVADGMGGGARGEVASQLAVNTVMQYVREQDWYNPADILEQAFRKANEVVHDRGTGGGEAPRSLMGTTLVAALVHDQSGNCWVANVGDSRAYLLRDGQLQQLTRDDSLVAERVRAGQMTEEEARHSRERNVITRAIGIEPEVTPEVSEAFPLAEGDLLLLCSDGLHGLVDDTRIAALLTRTRRPFDDLPKALVDAANRRGGTDNVTAMVGGLAPPAPLRAGPADATLLETRVARRRRRAGTGLLREANPIVLVAGGVALMLVVVVLILALGGQFSGDSKASAGGGDPPSPSPSTGPPTSTAAPGSATTSETPTAIAEGSPTHVAAEISCAAGTTIQIAPGTTFANASTPNLMAACQHDEHLAAAAQSDFCKQLVDLNPGDSDHSAVIGGADCSQLQPGSLKLPDKAWFEAHRARIPTATAITPPPPTPTPTPTPVPASSSEQGPSGQHGR